MLLQSEALSELEQLELLLPNFEELQSASGITTEVTYRIIEGRQPRPTAIHFNAGCSVAFEAPRRLLEVVELATKRISLSWKC